MRSTSTTEEPDVSPPSFVANFDSATAMAMATANFLNGEDFTALGNPEAMKGPAKAVNWLPTSVREKIFILGGALETISPRRLGSIDLEDTAAWLADEYPERPYPAVAIGSSNGALVHLWSALGIPWLPQTFLLPVRQRVHPDDPMAAFEKGIEPGRELLEANPDWQLHHMHDANQDRLMVRALTYFRMKRRRLGPVYERFLADRLPPGGTIFVVDCGTSWRTTTVGDRHFFQHGALGGATQEEFHSGSERVAEYLERYDSPVRRWEGPEPDTERPEAEWGFEPALLDDIERVAAERRYRVVRLRFHLPHDASPFVADLHRWWNQRRRIPSDRLVVESFAVHAPHWILRTGSVPYWMTFNMRPSLEALHAYLDGVDPYEEILLTLFQHGVRAVGLPSADDWRGVLDRATRRGWTGGADLDEFPYDFAQFARYDDALKSLPARFPLPVRLPLDELERFAEEHAGRHALEWSELAPAKG
jgi:hypothetical protein